MIPHSTVPAREKIGTAANHPYAAIADEILPRLDELAACRSTREMEAHPVYRAIAPVVERSLATPLIADFREDEHRARHRSDPRSSVRRAD